MSVLFRDFFAENLLPSHGVSLRRHSDRGCTIAMVSHAPSPGGIQYPPVNELIISIVRKSQQKRVIREFTQSQEAFVETKGCICVTPPNTPSYWRFEGSPEVLHIAVPVPDGNSDGAFVDELTEDVRLAAIKPYYDRVVEALADRIWEVGSSNRPASGIVCDQAALALAGLVYQKISDGPRKAKTTLPQWRLKRAMELLSANLADPPPIDELARSVGLSPSHFSRAFAASTGFSPYEWLSRERIERAKRLLETTDSPTTDIAFDLGFCSPNHFASRFRQFTGVSPREWRRARPAPK